MKFTDEKALEVVKKFNLSESTIAVWRLRGTIPAKYFKEGFKISAPTTARIQKKIVQILQSEKINITALAKSSGLPFIKFQDVRRGMSSFSSHEVIAIRKALNIVRADGKKHIDTFVRKGKFNNPELEAFRTFLADTPELVITKIFFDKKFIDWKNGKQVYIYNDIEKAIDNLSVFILETSIPEQ